MTLTQLRYIIIISEAGSLNKAAELLYITQPSLTNSLKELEDELGVELFYRSGILPNARKGSRQGRLDWWERMKK